MDRVREVPLQFTRRIPLTEKTCPACGTVFEAPAQRVYCSPQCRYRADWARHGQQRNARRKARKEQPQ
jgi:uncharacterized Zn finger protein (UPF0148 family)